MTIQWLDGDCRAVLARARVCDEAPLFHARAGA